MLTGRSAETPSPSPSAMIGAKLRARAGSREGEQEC
jgi:hypothetical protein